MSDNHENNGKPAVKEKALVAVKIFRLEPGAVAIVRMLSPTYGGIFTHWYQKRSRYCRGKDCPATIHNVDPVWKGYAAVEVNTPKTNIWVPWVLEISEHLERDMREVYCRGQVWELWREVETRGKRSPCMGKLHDQGDAKKCRPAFEILPVLKSIYHVFELELSCKNPLPMRVMAEVAEGELPEVLKPKQSTPADPSRSYAEEFRRRNAQRQTPTERNRQG